MSNKIIGPYGENVLDSLDRNTQNRRELIMGVRPFFIRAQISASWIKAVTFLAFQLLDGTVEGGHPQGPSNFAR